jgi:PhzF family phenazine biosynthesis protein
MAQTIYQVDAFTDRAFAGNPAGVCLLPSPADEAWMQAVASEMNLAETAFLYTDGDAFALRWFTPAIEVDLCGHATLASAHVLWQTGVLAKGRQARFMTKSGLLTADQDGDWIRLDFPATPATEVEAPEGLLEALGVTSRYVGRSTFDYLVEVASEAEVRAVAPDFGRLRLVDCRGVIVTAAASTAGFDFVSRFFAPAAGINEDSVTGSSHCCLAPYWAEKLGKRDLVAYQSSSRGGVLRLRVAENDRIHISGQAKTVLRCELLVD